MDKVLVLDTDVLTIVQRRSGAEYSRLDAKLEEASKACAVCVTIISYEEQMRGWLSVIAKARTLEQLVERYKRLHDWFDEFQRRVMIDFDDRSARQYQELMKSKIRIGTMDLKIVAITLVSNATLLSRNLKDFRKVSGLRVEDWTTE